MTTIVIEGIKDIAVDEYAGNIDIDFKDHRESKTTLELSQYDAEFLKERLEEFFHKQTFDEMQSELEDKIQELQDSINALMEENANLRLGYMGN